MRYLGAQGGRGGDWSQEDISLLLQMRRESSRWPDIAETLGRYAQDVRNKWREVAKTERRGRWTAEEEARLKKLVRKALRRRAKVLGIVDSSGGGGDNGEGGKDGAVSLSSSGMASAMEFTDNLPWQAISSKLGGRSHTQCRNKWRTMQCAAFEMARLDQDLALVRVLHASGAEYESEVVWSRLLPYISGHEARRRILGLARRIGFDDLSGDVLGEVVDRLKVLLEAVHTQRQEEATDLLEGREHHAEESRLALRL